jgi:hypothetical protein
VAGGTAVLCALPAVIAVLPVRGAGIGPAALRTRMLASARVPYQGYTDSTLNFGLPDLPGLDPVSDLLDGNTNQYVWYRSPSAWRADDVTGTGESDTYVSGQLTTLWDYGHGLFTQVFGSQPIRLPRAADLLPPALARRLLHLASRADRMSPLPARRIAGVAAAGLRLVPADPASTVGAVDLWADPRTGLPLQVQVFPRGSALPVLDTSFLQLSLSRPAAAVTTPHPAPGVGIAAAKLPSVDSVLGGDGDGDHDGTTFPLQLAGRRYFALPGAPSGVAVYGSGFSRFVLLPLPRGVGGSAVSAATNAGAAMLTLSGHSGALIQTPLVTVVMVKAGFRNRTFLFAGAVNAALLEQAAAALISDLQARFRSTHR